MINSIPVHRLEEIELRLVGADFRPWGMSPREVVDDRGYQMICKTSQRAMKKAIRKSAQVGAQKLGVCLDDVGPDDPICDAKVMQRELTLFHRTHNTTQEMFEFVMHAPEDIELLLRENKLLLMIAQKATEERASAIGELQSSKIAASRAEERIVDMRRAWRTLVKEMGTKP